MTGGVGIAEEWTGDAGRPRPLARHARPRPRADRPRAPGRVRGALARGHRRDPERRGLPSAPRGARGRRPDAARPLAVGRRRHERRVALLPGDRLGARVPRPDRRVLRAPPGVHRRAGRRRAARRRGSGSSSPAPTSTRSSCAWPGRDAYDELLDAGARIFEYQPTMLHAKTMVVDGAWSSVGTVNFDNRSFQLHDEVTLGIWDEHFARLLTEQFERDLESAEEIDPERWAKRGARDSACRGGDAPDPARALTDPGRRVPPYPRPRAFPPSARQAPAHACSRPGFAPGARPCAARASWARSAPPTRRAFGSCGRRRRTTRSPRGRSRRSGRSASTRPSGSPSGWPARQPTRRGAGAGCSARRPARPRRRQLRGQGRDRPRAPADRGPSRRSRGRRRSSRSRRPTRRRPSPPRRRSAGSSRGPGCRSTRSRRASASRAPTSACTTRPTSSPGSPSAC